MSYLLIMKFKYLQHCWTTFVTSCLTMRLSISHHKELRMYGAITNSAVYVTVTVTFSCWLANMAVTRNFHVGLTYVHLRTVPKCTCSLSFLFATDLLFLVFLVFSLSSWSPPHWYPWDGSWLHSTYMYMSNYWPFYLS